MRYVSTRGSHPGSTFRQALFSGWLPDGGIYLPEEIPTLSRELLVKWREKLSYRDILLHVLSLYVGDEIPPDHLKSLVSEAAEQFDVEDMVRLVRLDGGLNILELFHGQTWAFKDLAMACVGKLLHYFLRQEKRHIIVLVGTSGDTGSSAIQAVRGLDFIDIVVLFPKGRVTQLQELQMTTAMDDNVHVLGAVDATSDDVDIPIKDCFLDEEFSKKYHLIGINSINWARIAVQTAHHIYSYLAVCEQIGKPVQIVAPTGAAGNVTAALVACKMGVPLKLVCAVNTNDIIYRTLEHGEYSMRHDVVPTYSSAMDIQIPYNMERLWMLALDGDVEVGKQLVAEFEKTGSVKLPDTLWKKLREYFSSIRVSEDEMKQTLLEIWQKHDYIVCPHTAVGCTYHRKYRLKDSLYPCVYIATASPIKFPAAVSASGVRMGVSEKAESLYNRPSRCQEMPASRRHEWGDMLRQKIVEISQRWQDTV